MDDDNNDDGMRMTIMTTMIWCAMNHACTDDDGSSLHDDNVLQLDDRPTWFWPRLCRSAMAKSLMGAWQASRVLAEGSGAAVRLVPAKGLRRLTTMASSLLLASRSCPAGSPWQRLKGTSLP